MNTIERVERIRELMSSGADPFPWTVGKLSNIYDAEGHKLFDSSRSDELTGVRASNVINAEIVEHMSHLAHEDFLFVVPEMREHGEVAQLQEDVHEQANRLFPNRTPAKAFLKLYEELGEVIKDPKNPSEWGDVFILLLDLAKMFNINVTMATRDKMAVLEDRVWKETDTGTYQHVPGIAVKVAEAMVGLHKMDAAHTTAKAMSEHQHPDDVVDQACAACMDDGFPTRMDIIGQNGNTGDHYGAKVEPLQPGRYINGELVKPEEC